MLEVQILTIQHLQNLKCNGKLSCQQNCSHHGESWFSAIQVEVHWTWMPSQWNSIELYGLHLGHDGLYSVLSDYYTGGTTSRSILTSKPWWLITTHLWICITIKHHVCCRNLIIPNLWPGKQSSSLLMLSNAELFPSHCIVDKRNVTRGQVPAK